MTLIKAIIISIKLKVKKPYKWIHFYFFAKLIQIFGFIQKIALKNFIRLHLYFPNTQKRDTSFKKTCQN